MLNGHKIIISSSGRSSKANSLLLLRFNGVHVERERGREGEGQRNGNVGSLFIFAAYRILENCQHWRHGWHHLTDQMLVVNNECGWMDVSLPSQWFPISVDVYLLQWLFLTYIFSIVVANGWPPPPTPPSPPEQSST